MQEINQYKEQHRLPVNISQIVTENSSNDSSNSLPTIYFDEVDMSTTTLPCFNHVALGGSFDHMHNGHRKLLYFAVCCCQRQQQGGELTVGVTGDAMLASKQNAHLIDPYSVRAGRVREFINELDPTLKLNVVVSFICLLS